MKKINTILVCMALLSISSCVGGGRSSSNSVIDMPLRIFLKDGIQGYSGTTDTSIYKVPNTFNNDPGTFQQLYTEAQVDASTGIIALIRFDMTPVISRAQAHVRQIKSSFSLNDCNSQVIVNNAQLQLFVIAGGGSGGTTPALVLSYFKDTAPTFDSQTADWTNANPSEIWSKTGTPVETFNDILRGVHNSKDMLTTSFGRYYIFTLETDIVKKWICNPSMNTGMNIQVKGGGTGGSMHFFSREFPLIKRRPMLILDLKVQTD